MIHQQAQLCCGHMLPVPRAVQMGHPKKLGAPPEPHLDEAALMFWEHKGIALCSQHRMDRGGTCWFEPKLCQASR